MTKEEILNKIIEIAELEGLCPDGVLNEKALNILQKNFDETERLKAELEEKNKEIQEWKKDLEVKYHEKHRDDEYYINKIKHLNSILKGKDSEIESLKDILKIGNKSEKIRKMQVEINDMCLENDSLKNNISKLQSELTDLKEKHKMDVKLFLETLHFHGYIDHDITKLDSLIEQYYKQKFESND